MVERLAGDRELAGRESRGRVPHAREEHAVSHGGSARVGRVLCSERGLDRDPTIERWTGQMQEGYSGGWTRRTSLRREKRRRRIFFKSYSWRGIAMRTERNSTSVCQRSDSTGSTN